MRDYIKLKRRDGKEFIGKFKVLDESYIDKIMEAQRHISNSLTNKDWYSETSREEFLIQLNRGKVIGCLLEDESLIALGAYIEWGYECENYGYDLDMIGEEVLIVGQIEATFVHEDFRGNSLQKLICLELESIAKENSEIIAVTIHPDNIYSLNTFENLGYEIIKEKLKYGGLRRFILKKYL